MTSSELVLLDPNHSHHILQTPITIALPGQEKDNFLDVKGNEWARVRMFVSLLELITFEILAAERLRLMGFDN